MAIERKVTLQVCELTGGGLIVSSVEISDDHQIVEMDPLDCFKDLHGAAGFVSDLVHRSFPEIKEEKAATISMPAVLKATRSAEIIKPRTGFWRKMVGGRAA